MSKSGTFYFYCLLLQVAGLFLYNNPLFYKQSDYYYNKILETNDYLPQ